MPVRMCVIGVSTWSPIIARIIKPRSSEDHYNSGIGWFRAERQCENNTESVISIVFISTKFLTQGLRLGYGEKHLLALAQRAYGIARYR
jgi:hypothetical protein